MMRGVLILSLCFAAGAIKGFPTPIGGRTEAETCVVIQELTGSKPLLQRGDCAIRLSPASTFKIPHALVALQTGVVTTNSVERWNGSRYEQQPEWNRDHTVISALRPSVLWFFPFIGAGILPPG